MTVLISGGAGFIGSRLIPLLSRVGLAVVVLDNLHPQVHGPSQSVPRFLADHDVSFHLGDVADPSVWNRVLADVTPSVVVHLAAETGTGQSLREAARHAEVNVTGTAVMLDALVRAERLPKRVVLTSSRAVYGEGAWIERETGARFYARPRGPKQLRTEQWDPIGPNGEPADFVPHAAAEVEARPTNVYAATKLAQENILGAWATAIDVELMVLRLQNVYGAGQAVGNPYTGVLTFLARQLLAGEVLSIFEGGGIVRDFVHVSDTARVIARCVEAPIDSAGAGDRYPRTFDIGSGAHGTLEEYARVLASNVSGGEVRITADYRLGDVRAAYADISAAEAELGYAPKVSFEEGAVELLGWVASEIR
jgi:dTDP-L-rhamnose 4-epimerase